ncbi:hypothetical protein ACFL1B_03040 [Nanoarchaeota archaeon]
MDPQEEWERAEKELEEKGELQQSSLWRYLRLGLSIILVILILTYILVDPNVRDVITGFFESSTVVDSVFEYGDKTIVFDGTTYSQLVGLWQDNQEAEFRACLGGTVNKNKYVVDKILLPDIHSANVYRVISGPCPDNTIIDLHSHPFQRCIASQVDLNGLEIKKKTSPDLLLAVMCTEERISFYG